MTTNMSQEQWVEGCTQVLVQGQDRLFMAGVRQALAPVLAMTIGGARRIPMLLTVRVYTGMTLPAVFTRQPEGQSGPLVIFASPACCRMLAGTLDDTQALFLSTELAVAQVQQRFRTWLSAPQETLEWSLSVMDYQILQKVVSGRPIQEVAARLGYNHKTLYTRQTALAARLGTQTRQELYLKARLVLRQVQERMQSDRLQFSCGAQAIAATL